MMVLWGQWFSEFKTPFGFNFSINEGVKDQTEDFGIKRMKVSHQFCIILATDNNLYSMGKSSFGALGIAKLTDSQKVANRIVLPEPVNQF